MELHADLTRRAVVHSRALCWVDSPEPGVRRKMLERDGEEVARATSVVRFDPGRHFPEHAHGLGEEFLVLEGVFADEQGEYPAGTYVRNPPGSSHAPWSPSGCTLFVKLRQMEPGESRTVVVDTRSACWQGDRAAEVRHLLLFSSDQERVELLRFEPGTTVTLPAVGGEELFVLEGDLEARSGTMSERLGSWSWLRQPPGEPLALSSLGRSTLYRKIGHLGRRSGS